MGESILIKMKLFLVSAALVAVAVAEINTRDTGAGECYVCAQNNKQDKCCSGNTECKSEGGFVQCTQTMPRRDDMPAANRPHDDERETRGEEDYCTICCGLDQESMRCCSGRNYCGCTKTLYPSCME